MILLILTVLNVDSLNSASQETKIQWSCKYDIYKQTVLILSLLSDSAQGRRGLYFQAQALYLSTRTS